MLIKEQRGKRCPLGYGHNVGYVSCEECDHWKHKLEGNRLDEYCTLLMEAES